MAGANRAADESLQHFLILLLLKLLTALSSFVRLIKVELENNVLEADCPCLNPRPYNPSPGSAAAAAAVVVAAAAVAVAVAAAAAVAVAEAFAPCAK